MDKAIEIFAQNGVTGAIALVLLYLLLDERKEHRATRDKLDELTGKYEGLVEKTIEAMSKVVTIVSERLPKRPGG